MILIADAGATKIQWVVINDGKASEPMETAGFNPYFMEPRILMDAVEKDLVPFINPGHIRQVYYYGAGCSTSERRLLPFRLSTVDQGWGHTWLGLPLWIA